MPRPAAATMRRVLTGVVLLVASSVLVGWWTGLERLTTVLPGLASMKPNTALCLAALALALSTTGVRQARARYGLAWFVLALATVTAVELATGSDLKVDRLLPFIDLHGGGARMAPATATALLLLAAGTLLEGHRHKHAAQAAGLLALLVGYVAAIGYLYGVSSLYTVHGYTSMALHTALSVSALALVLLLRPHGAVLEVLIRDEGSAGSLVRALLPFLVIGAPALGWLRLKGQDLGWYDTRFGVSILTTVLTITTVALLFRTSIHLREAEVDRTMAMRRVIDLNARLESTVERRTAELSESRARFTAAFASSPLGTALTNLDGVIEEVNRLLPSLASTTAEELLGRKVGTLFEDALEGEDQRLRRGLLLAGHGSYQLERRLSHAAESCWVRVSTALVTDETGPRNLLFQLEDITARKLAEERAEHMALHDALTDLPNRVLLLDRLRQALAQAARTGRGVGVLFLDLDRFKVVNDSLGHHAGDALLAEVGRRLRRTARQVDTVARLGGDEFVVVCPDVGSERDVLQVADGLRRAVSEAIELEGGIAEVDASIGVAYGVGHDDPDTLLRQADQAMYRAKDRGKARYEIFDDDLRTRINSRLDTELALRGAVERGEIETWFQPVVELADGSVVATEALVRWRRADRGLVLPADFVGVAEDVGLIKEIGTTVLMQACLAGAELPDGPAVSVNVSAHQFVRSDFLAVVERALAVSDLAPDRLWLELTESAVIEAVDSAARSFQSLRDRGVKIAIDDFGAGFSSFARLRRFPIDLIKIDMAFVRDLPISAYDRAIVEGIIRMAEALGIDVVAEGIESTVQRDLLRDLGCRYGQGFLYAEPSPIAAPTVAPLVPRPRSTAHGVEQEPTY